MARRYELDIEYPTVRVELDARGMAGKVYVDGKEIAKHIKGIRAIAQAGDVTRVEIDMIPFHEFVADFPARVTIFLTNIAAMTDLIETGRAALASVEAHAKQTGLTDHELEWLYEIRRTYLATSHAILEKAIKDAKPPEDTHDDRRSTGSDVERSGDVQRTTTSGPAGNVSGADGPDEGDDPPSDQ